MPDDPTTPAAPVAGGAPVQAPVAPNPPVTPPVSAPVAPPNGEETLTPEQLRDALTKARKEAASNRVDGNRLKELEAAEQKRKDAELSDTEKAAKRTTELETALKATQGRIGAYAIQAAASTAGIIDADVAAALLLPKVEYDAAGEPSNVAALIADLQKTKPHLFGTRQAPTVSSGGASNAGRQAGGSGTGAFTKESIAAMTPAEYQTNRAAIQAWQIEQYKASQKH